MKSLVWISDIVSNVVGFSSGQEDASRKMLQNLSPSELTVAVYLVPDQRWYFSRDAGVGRSVRILEISRYSCGSNLLPALATRKIYHFRTGTI